MNVIVGFSPGWSLARWGTKGPAGHAFVVHDSIDYGGKTIIEARWKAGVVAVPACSVPDLESKTIAAYRLIVNGQTFLHELFKSSGVGYNYTSVLLYPFAVIGNLIAGYDKYVPAFGGKNRDFCSEAIAQALIGSSVPGSWYEKMHPNALLDAVEDSPAFITYGGKLV